VSPILVRPVREQLEHDRIIRLLQTRFRRRFDVGINPGAEQTAPVSTPTSPIYPDVVLMSQDRGRKVLTIIEVETVESVNNLEALAEWVTFGRLRPSFHLYVPTSMMEVAKRLCMDHNVPVAEIHSYHAVGDELRFVPVYRAPVDNRPRVAAAPVTARQAQVRPEQHGGTRKSAPKAAAAKKPKPASKPAKAAARRPARPATLRHAQGRSEQSRGTKKTARSPKRK
jgi:hypothetical protein